MPNWPKSCMVRWSLTDKAVPPIQTVGCSMSDVPILGLSGCLALLLAAPTAAQDVRLTTWNIAGPERDAGALAQSAEDLLATVGPVDVLVLQEVISDEQVQAVAEALGTSTGSSATFLRPLA